jgi:transposase
VLRWVKPSKSSPWLLDLMTRKPRKLVGVALANKMARIAWTLMTCRSFYQPPKLESAA